MRRIDVVWVAVEDPDGAAVFAESIGIDGCVGVDPAWEFARQYGIDGIPAVLAFDHSGNLVIARHPDRVTSESIDRLEAGELEPIVDGATGTEDTDSLPLYEAVIRPSTTPEVAMEWSTFGFSFRGLTIEQMLSMTHQIPWSRIDVADTWSNTKFDATVFLLDSDRESQRRMMEQLIANALHADIVTTEEVMWVRQLSVMEDFELSPLVEQTRGLSLDSHQVTGQGTMAQLADFLDRELGMVVTDDTGLTGVFDFALEWDTARLDDVEQELETIGLRLRPVEMPIRMLKVIESK